jgi:hypothetical protein
MKSQLRTEVIFREDIRALLQALDQANGVLDQFGNQQITAYREGFAAALEAVATAYDLYLEPPPRIRLEMNQKLISGYGE